MPELVTGWSSGTLDIRSVQNGDVLYKDTLGAYIAGIVQVRRVGVFPHIAFVRLHNLNPHDVDPACVPIELLSTYSTSLHPVWC